MDFEFSAAEQAFRVELRAWLDTHAPGDWARLRLTLDTDARARFLIDWQRRLHAAGWVGLHWPIAHGGRGATVMEQVIFYEEMARARAPELANAIGLDMAGPAIMVHGTEAQKRLHLPRILSAEMLGREHGGWEVAMTTLGFERGPRTLTRQLILRQGLAEIIELARAPGRDGRSAACDPIVRQRLAQLYIDAEALRYANLRILTRLVKGEPAGPEGSASKLFFSETWQTMADLGLELQGAYATLAAGSDWTIEDGRWQYRALRSRGNTIQGGTSEIMRNILAERVLGLAKDGGRSGTPGGRAV